MPTMIKILKLMVAAAFLGLAVLFLMDEHLFGIEPGILVLPVAVAAVVVLWFDFREKRKNTGRKDPEA